MRQSGVMIHAATDNCWGAKIPIKVTIAMLMPLMMATIPTQAFWLFFLSVIFRFG